MPIVIDWNLLRGELNPQNYVITDIEWLPEYRDAAGTIVAEAPKFCDVENGGLRLVIDDDTDSETDPDPKYIYTPNKQINGLEVPLYFKVTMMAHTVEENGDKKEVETQNVYAVHIVPATTVYYEPVKEFIGIEGDWELQGEADIPQKSVAVLKDDLPYGQDPAYEAANGPDAAGCYLQAKTKGDTAIIDFTGTGIELYANCTPDTGLIMAVLQDKEGKHFACVFGRYKG